jgi:hypothetical protein
VVEPYYADPGALIERAGRHSNVAYLYRDPHGALIAFALFAYEELLVEGEGIIPALYAGLCASSLHHHSRGIVFMLWHHACREALQWEKDNGKRLLAWAITATPVTYYGASMFHELEPKLDGTFAASSLRYVDALKQCFSLPLSQGAQSHPFVLKKAAYATRYSPLERENIRAFSLAKNFRLFEHLGIKEEEGDRLLMIGRFKNKFTNSAFRSEREQQK